MAVHAAVMVEPGQIEIREFSKPTPADDALLLKVDAVGICGSDKHMYLGHTALKFPVIPGHEVVGTVADIGKDANRAMNVMGGPIKEGDQVTVVPGSKNCGTCYYCLRFPSRPTLCTNRTIYGFSNCESPPHLTGEFSEYTYIHGNSWVYKMPDEIPENIRVLTEPVAVATRAVERACAPGGTASRGRVRDREQCCCPRLRPNWPFGCCGTTTHRCRYNSCYRYCKQPVGDGKTDGGRRCN